MRPMRLVAPATAVSRVSGSSWPEARNSPVPMATLLDNPLEPMSLFDEYFYMQATMFEPVGGMSA